MSVIDTLPPRNQPPVTELLTSTLSSSSDDPGDSIFEDENPLSKRWRISLFWYTFGLLMLVLIVTTAASYWLVRVLEEAPRMRANTRQIVSIVLLTRTALLYANPAERSQIETLIPHERLHLIPRTPTDRIQPFPADHDALYLASALHDQLGVRTEMAQSVNGQPGLWVSFTTGSDNWWLYFDDVIIEQGLSNRTWFFWTATRALLFLIGSLLVVRLVNRPLRALAGAATQVRKGDFANSHLDENVPQSEVYEVYVHFNHMAEQLAHVEQERAQMLAGISHDLRTPLARLRLEIELGVSDEETRERMASDIEQVGSILNKFLDYARPNRVQLRTVNLYKVVRKCARGFAKRQDMAVQVDMPTHIQVLADEVELGRVIVNLLENASRYGQTPGTGFTKVRMAATVKDGWAKLRVRDYGAGVPENQLTQLTRPFYRGDTARKNAAGTGLGLAIAARMIEAMGGKFRIFNASSGGLQALIGLKLADEPDDTQTDSKPQTRPHKSRALPPPQPPQT